jgi:hypothetical protein
MTLKEKLNELGACQAFVAWVGDRTLEEAWAECHRGDWMMVVLGHQAGRPGWPSQKDVVRITIDVLWEKITGIDGGFEATANGIMKLENWVTCSDDCCECVRDELNRLMDQNQSKQPEIHVCAQAITTIMMYVVYGSSDDVFKRHAGVSLSWLSLLGEIGQERAAQADYIRSQVDVSCEL